MLAKCGKLKLHGILEEETPEPELRVQVLNINEGFNEDLKEHLQKENAEVKYMSLPEYDRAKEFSENEEEQIENV